MIGFFLVEADANRCIVCGDNSHTLTLKRQGEFGAWFVHCKPCGKTGGARETRREAVEDWNFLNQKAKAPEEAK